MLKPYAYVVCEKVIIDKNQDGVASLIALFSKIIATVPADSPEIPANAAIPKDWAIFSSWDSDPSDAKEYALCTQILYPDKSQFGEMNKIPVLIEANKRAQVVANVQGFPIGQAGQYTVRTWLEDSGKPVVEPLELKIEVEIRKQAPAAQGN